MNLVYKGFKSTKPFFWNGFFLAAYVISALGCFASAYSVQALEERKKADTVLNYWSALDCVNIYSITLPLF